MILAMTGRRRYHDKSHGSCCCSRRKESIGEPPWRQGGRALHRNTEYRIPDHASILCLKAGRRAGERTDPSSVNGGLYSHRYDDLRLSEIDVSEKYLAFDEKPCYSDSQPEPPLFMVFFNDLTIKQKGDLGYFFNLLTGH